MACPENDNGPHLWRYIDSRDFFVCVHCHEIDEAQDEEE